MSGRLNAIISSPPRVQYTVPFSVPGDHMHLPQNNVDILTRPPVDSWYIRAPAGVDRNHESPPRVNKSPRKYTQSVPSMSQPQSPRGYPSPYHAPVNNNSQNSVRPSANTSQSQTPRAYASAHHTTPQHASTSNGYAHTSHAHPQVVVPAGPGHQGVGHQQAEAVGLGIVDAPLSPFAAWSKEPSKQSGYSQLHSPAQQHTPYYAPVQNASPLMTPHSQHQHQHQAILTRAPQIYIKTESPNGSPHLAPRYPHTPQTNGRPSASPHLNHTIPNGNYTNGSPHAAPHYQQRALQTNGTHSPHVYPTMHPASPTKRPQSLRADMKYANHPPPTTTQPASPQADSRPFSLKRKNTYSDDLALTPIPSHAGDTVSERSFRDKLPIDTASGKAIQDRIWADQQQREQQQRKEELERAEEYQRQQREQQRRQREQERAEAFERKWLDKRQDCIKGGPKSCTALMESACFYCIKRQCERK